MNTEIEGFTLVLLVVISAVMLFAAILRMARQYRLRKEERELDAEQAHQRALRRLADATAT